MEIVDTIPKKYILHEKHMKKFRLNSTFGCVGRRGSGKSTIIKCLMYYFSPYIRLPIIFSHTADKNGEYDKYVPSSLIYANYNKNIIALMIAAQTKLLLNKKRDKRKKIQGLIVFDDVVAQIKAWKNDPRVIEMFTEGRHTRITTILGVHDLKDLAPKIRNQFDYVILTQESRENRLNFFYNTYWPQEFVPDKKQFKKIVEEGTRGYRSLVIDIKRRGKPGAKFSNCVFYMKPPNPKKLPNFKVGNKIYWKIHKLLYNPNWRVLKWENIAKKNQLVFVSPIKKSRSNRKNKKTTIIIPKMEL